MGIKDGVEITPDAETCPEHFQDGSDQEEAVEHQEAKEQNVESVSHGILGQNQYGSHISQDARDANDDAQDTPDPKIKVINELMRFLTDIVASLSNILILNLHVNIV